MSCGPALSGTRTVNRPSTASPVVVGLSLDADDLLVAAERGQVHALAVHGDLELVRVLEPAHRPEVGAEQLDLELVLAVERQRRIDQHAADRAERQALDVPVLRRVLPHAVDLAGRRESRGSPTASAADALGGGQVALEQHRRHAEHVGDVVEAGARVVGRQQRRGVDRRSASRSRMALAYSARFSRCSERPARIGRRRAAVDPASPRATRPAPAALGGVGPRHAGRRHHAAADLPDHLLPDVRVRGDVGEVRTSSASPPVFAAWL